MAPRPKRRLRAISDMAGTVYLSAGVCADELLAYIALHLILRRFVNFAHPDELPRKAEKSEDRVVQVAVFFGLVYGSC